MKNSGVVSLTNLILQIHTTHPMDSKYFQLNSLVKKIPKIVLLTNNLIM